VDRDARRDHPHGAFAAPDAPDLHVVTASDGDAMARVTVRALETRESIRLVGEFIRRLEPGPLRIALAEPLPGGRIGISAIESARGEAVHWLRTGGPGRRDGDRPGFSARQQELRALLLVHRSLTCCAYC
jgi:Ni,Fe-hydrogenase III large subunit